uniref:Uncharacterized protein n=1 Tax=Romanomermis culicivorax TaxID=13658 RepID=A0A915L140_ROMCU
MPPRLPDLRNLGPKSNLSQGRTNKRNNPNLEKYRFLQKARFFKKERTKFLINSEMRRNKDKTNKNEHLDGYKN